MNENYSIFYLELALNREDDTNIYAFENVSHIPTNKLIEIFEIDLKKDPELIEGYFLSRESYLKHKTFIDDNLPKINFNLFEYCLRRYSIAEDKMQTLFKKSLFE
jgi:hypothetical protein